MTIRSSSSDVSSPALWVYISRLFKYSRACEIECVPLVEVNIGLLANQVGVTTSDTLYLGERVLYCVLVLRCGGFVSSPSQDCGCAPYHDLLLSLNIGVQKSENELKVRLLAGYERHDGWLVMSSRGCRFEMSRRCLMRN